MSATHNQIHRGIFSDAIKRALGMTKSEAGVERISETMTPVINPWGLPEWAYLRAEALWAIRVGQPAVALEAGMVAIVNPPNSNQIVIVDGANAADITAAASFDLLMSQRAPIAATLALTTVQPVARDTRWSSPGAGPLFNPAVEAWAGTDLTVPFNVGILEQANQLAGSNAFAPFMSPPYVLKPNDGLIVQCQTVNNAIQVNLWGRVRKVLPGELTDKS